MALRLCREFLARRVSESVKRSQLVQPRTEPAPTREDVRRRSRSEATFTKNTLTAKGFEAAAAALVPLLQGSTAPATGPTEVPLAAALALSKTHPEFFVLGAMVNGSRVLEFMDVERSPSSSRESLHTQMVSQMLPGEACRCQRAAYLVGVLQMRVEQMRAERAAALTCHFRSLSFVPLYCVAVHNDLTRSPHSARTVVVQGRPYCCKWSV